MLRVIAVVGQRKSAAFP